MTWRDWLVAQAHEPLPGQHLSAKRMVAALELVAWWDSMKVDAEKWVKSCRICAARLNKPRTSQPLKSLSSYRPFTVLVYDFVFVSPQGEHGEIGCLSAICTYTKYLWLRPVWSTSAAEAAWVSHVNDIGDQTLRATCQSWYFGSNIPGKPRVILPYAGGFPAYTRKCDAVAADGYAGFALG